MNENAKERYEAILSRLANVEVQLQIMHEKHRAHEELFLIKIKELQDGIKKRSKGTKK